MKQIASPSTFVSVAVAKAFPPPLKDSLRSSPPQGTLHELGQTSKGNILDELERFSECS